MECLKETDERGKEGLLRNCKYCIDDDLVVFRWFERQIRNKKAITACLLVLQGSAYNGVLPVANQVEET